MTHASSIALMADGGGVGRLRPLGARPAAVVGPRDTVATVVVVSDPGVRLPANFGDVMLIGEGGEGAVYGAFDRRRGLRVAVKILHEASLEQAHVLKREFRVLAGLRHPGLVRLFDLGVELTGAWFSREYVEGTHLVAALTDARAAGPPCLVPRFLDLAIQITSALTAVHAGGYLHRDLKPGNVLVDTRDRVVLLDFGMVARLRPDRRFADQDGLAGTLPYLPPEAFLGAAAGPAWDSYGLGVLFCEALLGRLPFPTELALALPDKLAGPGAELRAELEAIDPRLAACIVTLMAIDPQTRISVAEAGRLLAARLELSRAAETDAAATSPAMVGREAELAALRAWSRQPGFSMAQIRGPSGIGKTTLVRELVESLRSAGELVLVARCHPNEMVPFNGLDPILDDICRLLLQDPAHTFARGLEGPLVALFPAFQRLSWPTPADPPGGALEIVDQGLHALSVLLGRIARHDRLTLWIDDVQWADVETLRVLQGWATSTEPPPMRVGITARDGGALSLPVELTLELGELSPAAAQQLARRLLPVDDPNAVVRVCDEARGNPLFVEQLSRVATRAVNGVPSLEAVVATALTGLPADAGRTLALLAVAGRPIDLDLLEACGVARALVFELEHCLLATRSGAGRDLFEVVHDRLRGAVLAELDAEGVAAGHCSLADALIGRAREGDAPQIAAHLHSGRGPEPAGPWARRAGEYFAAAFAFDTAAQWFRHALAWTPAHGDTRVLLAEALVRAGRGTEAGREYARRADEDAGSAPEHLQKAAECFLAAGALADGMCVLQPLLSRRGIAWPMDPRRVMLGMFFDLGVVAWRSRGTRRAPATSEHIHDTDLCWSAAKGLLGIDPVRGAAFALAGLRRILGSADRARIARHYAAVGAIVLAPASGRMADYGRRMIDRAACIATELDDAYLVGFVQVCRGQYAVLAGEWAEARRCCEEGVTLLRNECPGATWESHIGEMGLLRALQELGQFATLRRRATSLRERATSLDDRYAEVTGRLFEAIGQVSMRRSAAAREHVRLALERWSDRPEAEMQRMYAGHILAMCDLVEDDVEAAWARVETAWPLWERSQLLRFPVSRIDCLALRLRIAVCVALAMPGRRAGLMAQARRAITHLGAERRTDAKLLAATMSGLVEGIARGESAKAPHWTHFFPHYIDSSEAQPSDASRS